MSLSYSLVGGKRRRRSRKGRKRSARKRCGGTKKGERRSTVSPRLAFERPASCPPCPKRRSMKRGGGRKRRRRKSMMMKCGDKMMKMGCRGGSRRTKCPTRRPRGRTRRMRGGLGVAANAAPYPMAYTPIVPGPFGGFYADNTGGSLRVAGSRSDTRPGTIG